LENITYLQAHTDNFTKTFYNTNKTKHENFKLDLAET